MKHYGFVVGFFNTVHQTDRKTSSNKPTLLVVNTYTVRDNWCNVRDRYFIILSNGHQIVRALLKVSINGNGSLLQLGDIMKINQYNMVIAEGTYIVMISDFYVKQSSADKPNGFLEWFSIVVDSVKDTKSLDLNDKVWFTASINHPVGLSAEENNDVSDFTKTIVTSLQCVQDILAAHLIGYPILDHTDPCDISIDTILLKLW